MLARASLVIALLASVTQAGCSGRCETGRTEVCQSGSKGTTCQCVVTSGAAIPKQAEDEPTSTTADASVP